MLVDTHIHLDDDRYGSDLDELLLRAKSVGVQKFIIPAADPQTLKRAVSLASRYEDIYFAVGVHPYDIDNYDEALLLEYVDHKKCVAVGECGLDYYRLDGTNDEEIKTRQKEIFIAQIALAKRYKKPLIVHIRDASRDSKSILLEQNASEVGGVLHCYNADEELLSLAKNGFYFGVGGVVTFKNAKKLINVLPKIPLDRLLVETDGPYLTPHPHRGERNEPSYIAIIVQKIAEILCEDEQKIAKITTQNALKLFDIK